MSDEEIIDAEIVVDDESPAQENRVVQVTSELEVERLKTRRAELATERTKRRWDVTGAIVVLTTAFASCAQCINPW